MLFFSFVCHFSRILYSSSVAAGMSRAACISRDWDPEKGWSAWSLQWLPPVISLKRNLLSYADMQCFLALRRWLFAWLCFCSVFFFFNCLKLPCIKIYKHAFLQTKHPCFTRDLGPLCTSSHWLQSPGPHLQRPWQNNRELKNYIYIYIYIFK